MPTPASIGRHPIHPMLVDLPIGLWVFSVVADLIFWSGFGGAAWKVVALYSIGGGVVAALVAAVAGFVDFLSITVRRVKRVGLWHLAFTLLATVVFAVSFALRLGTPLGTLPVVVSIGGLVVLGAAGWLGGELVFVHGMGVEAAE
jgi:uncharacterized membrane protein